MRRLNSDCTWFTPRPTRGYCVVCGQFRNTISEEKELHCLVCGSTQAWPKFYKKPEKPKRKWGNRPKSRYRGVFSDGNGHWEARYGHKYIITRATEEEAAEAYNAYAFAIHGNKKHLNVIVTRKGVK